MVALSVCCLGSAARLPPVKTAKRSLSLSTSWSNPIVLSLTAANSSAKGMPSRRRQRSVTSRRLASLTSSWTPAFRARSTRSATASE